MVPFLSFVVPTYWTIQPMITKHCVLIDFVKCVREQVLNGNTVKIDNLAIFKATVEANALETLYDADADKVASASLGTLVEGAKTGPTVKTVKLLAQSTGDFTREELKKDVKLAWTDKAKAEIAAAKGTTSGESGNSDSSNSGNSGSGSNSVTTSNGSEQSSTLAAPTISGPRTTKLNPKLREAYSLSCLGKLRQEPRRWRLLSFEDIRSIIIDRFFLHLILYTYCHSYQATNLLRGFSKSHSNNRYNLLEVLCFGAGLRHTYD